MRNAFTVSWIILCLITWTHSRGWDGTLNSPVCWKVQSHSQSQPIKSDKEKREDSSAILLTSVNHHNRTKCSMSFKSTNATDRGSSRITWLAFFFSVVRLQPVEKTFVKALFPHIGALDDAQTLNISRIKRNKTKIESLHSQDIYKTSVTNCFSSNSDIVRSPLMNVISFMWSW